MPPLVALAVNGNLKRPKRMLTETTVVVVLTPQGSLIKIKTTFDKNDPD